MNGFLTIIIDVVLITLIVGSLPTAGHI